MINFVLIVSIIIKIVDNALCLMGHYQKKVYFLHAFFAVIKTAQIVHIITKFAELAKQITQNKHKDTVQTALTYQTV